MLVLLAFCSSEIAAAGGSAELVMQCRSVKPTGGATDVLDAWNQGMCLGTLTGFRYGVRLPSALGLKSQICIPQEVTNGQLVAVYVKWVDQNPDKWHYNENVTVGRALGNAFRCER